MMSELLKFLFPPPPSLFVSAMSVISFLSLANIGLSEARGKHLQYSKFSNSNSQSQRSSQAKEAVTVSGKNGMLLAYTPAFLAGVTSFFIFPDGAPRFLFIKSALTLHFFKRILEVLCVHKYSGGMVLDTGIVISASYFLSTVTMIYSQHLTQGFREPPIDTKYVGIVLFLVGLSGNFYHHYLLSKLRGESEKEYKIPSGGLFHFVICPHYLCEIIGFWGVALISQTLYAFSFALGSAFYLTGRSYATRRWYESKFEDFPKHVKALVPFVF